VDAQTAVGGVVLVTNGLYEEGSSVTPGGALNNRVTITKEISVLSVNGPGQTTIRGEEAPDGGCGDGAVRCVYIGAGSISGFTFTNGFTLDSGDTFLDRSGGGAYALGGVVMGCTVAGSSANYYGGGMYRGVISNCSIFANTARISGGGTYYSTVANSTISGNSAESSSGGGTYYGTVDNSTISGNSAGAYGGGSRGGTLMNCVIRGNVSGNLGGGTHYSTVKNCTISGNSATCTKSSARRGHCKTTSPGRPGRLALLDRLATSLTLCRT